MAKAKRGVVLRERGWGHHVLTNEGGFAPLDHIKRVLPGGAAIFPSLRAAEDKAQELRAALAPRERVWFTVFEVASP